LLAQMPTEERLRMPGWWPTKGTFPRDEFVGAAVCAQCHASVAASQQQHAMARSSRAAGDSDVLRARAGSSFRLGPYSYQIVRTENDTFGYSVTDGVESLSGPLTWAFGTGKVGQTYLAQEHEDIREIRFSFFQTSQTFDVTPNQSQVVVSSLDRAAGRIVGEGELRRCFGCHATASTTSDRFDPSRMVLGVTCEACHGPGANHVAVEKGGLDAGAGSILNPKRLKPADQVDFCGACHTSWWDATLSGSKGVATVHFQPYRLQNSACWGRGDARLTCVACHDPHRPLVRDAAFYDQKCLSCHVSANEKPTADRPGSACPKNTKECVTCHMPRQESPDMHFEFADHQIRIAKPGARFPD
jgi:hypothetical protein